MYEVRARNRTFRFEGVLLAFSSSYRSDSPRWTEFSLYRTEGKGRYVLGRVGVSKVYHRPDCRVAKKNEAPQIPHMNVLPDYTGCIDCRPDQGADSTTTVSVEQNRYWGALLETPEAVVDALYQTNPEGARYMTYVAESLLEEAGEHDENIYEAYRVETIL